MRRLAELAGVSVQAVSLALRNHHSIGGKTRARIQLLAKRHGYAPDPHLAKLMHHLRARNGPSLPANICALTTHPVTVTDTFSDLLIAGGKAAARSAGFGFDVVHVEINEVSRRRLHRMLRSRGVEGLVLLPMADVRTLDDFLDWSGYSVISATLSVTSPHFDCVISSHFRNALNLCDRLLQAGFRRPGLIIQAQHDQRCGHNITAALAWHGIFGGTEPVRAHVCAALEPAAVQRWLAAEKPDVLVAERDEMVRLLYQHRLIPRQLPVVTCSAVPLPDGHFAYRGIYEEPRRIGGAAVEALARMITVGSRGVPQWPQMTLVSGSWVGGPILAKTR